jgi:hypothetical protein
LVCCSGKSSGSYLLLLDRALADFTLQDMPVIELLLETTNRPDHFNDFNPGKLLINFDSYKGLPDSILRSNPL